MKIPALLVLEEFFGVAPEVHGPSDEDLFYNRITFSAEVDGDTIWFETSPFAASAHLRLSLRPFRIVDFWFREVVEVSVRKTAADHNLFIHYGPAGEGECNVKLRPHIMVFQSNFREQAEVPLLSDANGEEED